MKTIDLLIRVSKLGDRLVSAESTLTIDDQRDYMLEAIAQAGARRGKLLRALDQSGFTAVDSAPFREALARVRRGDSDGLAVAYGDPWVLAVIATRA